MKEQFRYIEKKDRKKILLLCDDIRMNSGIATMAREFTVGTAQHFNWFNVGAAVKHPEIGKIYDLSEEVNKRIGITDSFVQVMPNNGYGDAQLIRALIKKEKPDAIFIFTDPRYWVWLFQIEREIRSKIPIFWLNIWDDYPAPGYNVNYYDSVDVLMGISKQTNNINRLVLGEKADSKILKYVPHGINETDFFPITIENPLYENLLDFRKKTLGRDDIEFIVFFNSRNIQRKKPADVILAYRFFCDIIGEEKAKKCALIMHTHVSDNNGTDLRAVKEALTDPSYVNVYFSQARINPNQMNLLYNISDVTVLISSNEGWGLSLTESMMAGKMIIGNVTGGMQDQMRFEKDGKWIDFDADFPSNHRGTVKECGEWVVPVFPSNISLTGSPTTPYIFDDRCQPEDVAKAIEKVYNLSSEDRVKRGLKGREWVTSDESQMSASAMCKNIIEVLDEAFVKFKPRSRFDLIKSEKRPSKYIKHKLTGY
tara:strand:+ start:956 stop:2401 length:1446 start_codon:yes stop_codon:yes gene_type:complete